MVLSQAPHVTVRDFLTNFFYTAVSAQADVNSHELNVLQMKACVIRFTLATVICSDLTVITPSWSWALYLSMFCDESQNNSTPSFRPSHHPCRAFSLSDFVFADV